MIREGVVRRAIPLKVPLGGSARKHRVDRRLGHVQSSRTCAEGDQELQMDGPAERFVDMKLLWAPPDVYRSIYGLGLTWTRHEPSVYELTCGDARVGRLWELDFGEVAGQVAGACWIFKKRGLSAFELALTRLTIHAWGSEEVMASFRKDTLRFSDGRHVSVAGEGSWYDATNQRICSQKLELGAFGGVTGGSSHVEPAAEHIPELSLILLLGWHLLVDAYYAP